MPVADDAKMHDWWLALVAAATGKIIYAPKPTVLYRKHGKNVIGAKGYYSEENLNRLFNINQLEKDLAAVEHGGFTAACTAAKYGIKKAGLFRSLVFYLLLMKRGYITEL